MKQKQKCNSYAKEFKLEAMRLTEESGGTSAQNAHDLGISVNLLKNWRQ